MKIRILLATLVCSVLALSSGAFAGDTLESVEKDIIAKWTKLKSLTAKTTMAMSMQGMSMKSQGTVEFLKKGDKELFRMDMTMSQSMGGQTQETSMSTIADGEYVYNVTDMMGQKRAMKQKPDSLPGTVGGQQMFEGLRKNNDLKLLPDETVDGQSVFVIEGTPKTAGRTPYAKSTMYFTKDAGIMIKMVGVDASGGQVMTMSISDIKRDPKIDPDRFVFKAPEGVQVMDLTERK